MWLDVLIKAKKIGLCMKYGIKEVCNDWAWHFQRSLLKLGIGPGLQALKLFRAGPITTLNVIFSVYRHFLSLYFLSLVHSINDRCDSGISKKC